MQRLMLVIFGKVILVTLSIIYMIYGAASKNLFGSTITLLSSFHMKSIMQNGLRPGIVRAKRFTV